MKALARVALVVLLGAPMVAFAGAGSVLNVSLGGGLVGTWTGKTLGIATSFVPFLFVVAFAVEAFGKAPSEPKDFGAVVWRCLVVVVLLFSYSAVFGGLYGLLDGVSKSVAPADTWDKLLAKMQEFMADKAAYQAQETVAAARRGSTADAAMSWATGSVDGLGGVLIDAVVSIILLAGEASFRIVGTFGQVLSLLLYVLGPLAIAASVPRGSDAGMKWLRVFVAVLLWPLISALLVGLLSEYALDALKPQSSYEAAYKSIGLAGILAVTAFAVPVIASALTGAGMGAVGSGWSSMGAWAGAATGGVGAAAAVAGLQPGRSGLPSLGAAQQHVAPVAGGGGGGGLQSAGLVGGGAGGGRGAGGGSAASPGWARGGVGSIAPAQASVSPAADAAAGRDVAGGGGVEFPAVAAAPAQPPPFVNGKPWSEGGIAPATHDDGTPTLKPVALQGPAAERVGALPPAAPGKHGVIASAGSVAPPVAPVAARVRAGGDAEKLEARDRHHAGGRPQSAARSPDDARPTVQVLPPFPKKR